MPPRVEHAGEMSGGEARQSQGVEQAPLRTPQSEGSEGSALQAVLFDAPLAAQSAKPKELWIAVHLPWIALEALRDEIAAPPVDSKAAAGYLPNAASRLPSDASHSPGALRHSPSTASHSLGAVSNQTPAIAASAMPIAIVELEARAQYVVAADEAASHAGVRPGMTLAAALALLPTLQAHPRDPRREQALLEQLATRALRFTSRVSIVPPDGLLLEVKGSLKLFGGAKSLGRAVRQDFLEAGARTLIALAPTPLAAQACARAGMSFIVLDPAKLLGRIGDLPLIVLRWPLEVLDRLAKVGVRSISEALRLPRAGFARRFGKEYLAMLDQLAGRSADLRKEFRARERFRQKRDFTYEIEHHEGVLEILGSLLEALEKFLRARQSGVTRLECRLKHRHAPITRCVLKLAAPEVDAARLKALFGERLATLVLPEPVRACELRSGDLIARPLQANSLWRPGEHGGGVSTESAAFIELLRARLGPDAVYGVQMFAEHRPEAAWRITEPEAHEAAARARTTGPTAKKQLAAKASPSIARSDRPMAMPSTPLANSSSAKAQSGGPMVLPSAQPANPSPAKAQSDEPIASSSTQSNYANVSANPEHPPWRAFKRPLWLLSEPRPLRERNHQPCYRGPLRLSEEPERIETGWWDGKDISRDYYRATDVRGVNLWIYRECTEPHQWFLHGFFG